MVRRGARMSNAHVLLHTQRTQEDCVQNHSKIFLPFFCTHKKKTIFLRSLILLSQWHLYEQRS